MPRRFVSLRLRYTLLAAPKQSLPAAAQDMPSEVLVTPAGLDLV